MKSQDINTIINEFKNIVATGSSKSAALDFIVNKYNQYNQPFIRGLFKSAAGWNY